MKPGLSIKKQLALIFIVLIFCYHNSSAGHGYVKNESGIPISGCTVELYSGDSNAPGALISSFITDIDGYYSYPDLTASQYFIKFAAKDTFPSQWQGQNNTTTIYPQFKIWLDPYTTELMTTLKTTPVNNSPTASLTVKIMDSTLIPIRKGEIFLFNEADSLTSWKWADLVNFDTAITFTSLYPGKYAIKLYNANPFPEQFYEPTRNSTSINYSVPLGVSQSLNVTMIASLIPKGSGLITGKVMVATAAVSGATVELHPTNNSSFTAYKTTTSTDGSFSFSEVAEQNYYVKIISTNALYPPQYYRGYMTVPSTHPEYPVLISNYNTDLQITLEQTPFFNAPKAMIKVLLQDKNNNLLEMQSEVWAINHIDQNSRKALFQPSTNEYWIDSLKEGNYNIKVLVPGYPSYYFYPDSATTVPTHPVYLGMNDTITKVVILKEVINQPKGYISGNVRDRNGPLSDVVIEVLDPNFTVVKETISDNGGNYGPLAVNASGVYVVSFRTPGYPLQYWTPYDRNTSTVSPLNYLQVLSDATVNINTELVQSPPTAEALFDTNLQIIEGYVKDKNSLLPIAGAQVLALPSQFKDSVQFCPSYVYSMYSSITDSSGYYRIRYVPSGSYLVMAKENRSGYVAQYYSLADTPDKGIVVQTGSTSPVRADFSLRKGGSLTGIIKSKNGALLPQVSVHLKEKDGGIWYDTWTDSSGRYRFDGLPTKEYFVSTWHELYISTPGNTPEYSITEKVTTQATDLILERGSVISGTVSTTDSYIQSLLSSRPSLGSLKLLRDTTSTDTIIIRDDYHLNMMSYNEGTTTRFSSSAAPSGSYRVLFTPHPQGDLATVSAPFMASAGWSLAGVSDWTKTTVYKITQPDSLKAVTFNLRKGYSIYGSIRMKDSTAINGKFEVTAFVKSGTNFFPVSHSYALSEKRFELPGLIDGEDYFLQVWSPQFESFFWSSTGSSLQPKTPYRFSTTTFQPVEIIIDPALANSTSEEIKNLIVQQTGLKRVELSWTAPATSTPQYYKVYRFPGDPALYRINASQTEYEPAIDDDSLLRKATIFTTKDVKFTDTTLVSGSPYIYRVVWVDPFGRESNISIPYPPDLSSYIINQSPTAFKAKANTWYMMGIWGTETKLFDSLAGNLILYSWDDKRLSDKLTSQYVQTRQMRPTAGYWFKSFRDTMITVSASAAVNLPSKQDSLKVKLIKGTSGWNQFSSPFPYSVKPNWVLSKAIWEWLPDSGGYKRAYELQPWKAYWINSTKDTSLSYYPQLTSTANLSKQTGSMIMELQITLKGEGVYDPDNYVGISGSLAKQTSTMELEPPPAFDVPQLYFIDQQSSEHLSKLYKSASSEKLEWKVGVSPSSTVLQINIESLGAFPDEMFLYWVDSRGAFDLRKNTQITIPASNDETFGYIVATTDAREASLLGGTVQLYKTGPNPFRGTTELAFVLPYSFKDGSDNQVSIDIYNLSGRKIRTLLRESRVPGRYSIKWDGLSDDNKAVPRGLYLIRLSYGKVSKSLRLVRAW